MKGGSAVLDQGFCLEEATIDELHHAIIFGQTTCVSVVRHYLDRVRAFNGVASMLVTEHGGAVLPVAGAVRGGTRLTFPAHSVKASEILPGLDKYKGPPLEYGRMEATASDPSVHQQFGMIVGSTSCSSMYPAAFSGAGRAEEFPITVENPISALVCFDRAGAKSVCAHVEWAGERYGHRAPSFCGQVRATNVDKIFRLTSAGNRSNASWLATNCIASVSAWRSWSMSGWVEPQCTAMSACSVRSCFDFSLTGHVADQGPKVIGPPAPRE
jgi:hypothetical protein